MPCNADSRKRNLSRICVGSGSLVPHSIDARTQVLVDPKDATAEYAEKLRQRYKLNYHRKAVGGRKKR